MTIVQMDPQDSLLLSDPPSQPSNHTHLILLFALGVSSVVLHLYDRRALKRKISDVLACDAIPTIVNELSDQKCREKEKLNFKKSYLIGFLCARAADWMQGPYAFAAYESLGLPMYQIASLFLVGYISGTLFGPFSGLLADKL